MSDAPPDPSVFTMIIRGDLPGRFVWRDDDVVAFLTIAPIRPGHTLVVPVAQIDQWTVVPADLWARVGEVQQAVGQALMDAFSPVRVGSIIAGLEVPHCHVHLIPIDSESQLSFANIDPDPDPASLDDAAARIRAALSAAGHGAHVPD
ncbi:HIT family protein [Dermatobacter hominis]|uniref:HIT family protein n=1 Tax=Dermatobacter hominis TaxID=2884263 RepID=UPI001D111A22|nr:HIT family protein [Dermatobacter hominis]UDY36335.1 HIT family protein [Dermatobacter hominis]